MKKKLSKISLLLSSIALSFGLLVGIKPRSVTPLNAETTTIRCGVEAEWEEWTSTTSLPTSGHYYLNNNVTITSNNIVLDSGDLYLDLNGFNIDFTYEGDSPDSAIYQSLSTNFYLYDSVGTGIIQKSNSANYERFIFIEGPYSIFEMNGGTIKNFKNSDPECLGGAIYVEAATFTLNDGVISDCSAGEGGAVYAWLSELNINGGTITNCSAYNVGGAIKVQDSDFNMTGGKICNNSTSGNGDLNQGGGIYAGVRIIANVTGGEICNNTANYGDGGGIYVADMFNISGSLYIHDNLAKYGRGGGLFSGYGDESSGFVNIDGGFFGFNFCFETNHDGFGKETDAYLAIDSGRFSTRATYTPSLVNETSKITFDKKGGTGGTDVIESQTWGTEPNKINIPSKEGYSFVGYYDAYGQQYFTDNGEATYKDESSNVWDYVGDQTLIAKWSANSYAVALDSREGTGGTTSVTVTYGASMPSITIPTKENYSFIGYFDATSNGTKYYNADGSSAHVWDKAANVTLYGNWEITIEVFSKQFIALTDGFCTESKDSVKSTLKSLFNDLSPDDKQVFINTVPVYGRTQFDDEIVLNAKSRYCYMISDYGYDDFLEIFDKDELNALRNRGNIISLSSDNDDRTSIIIVCLAFTSFATLLCLFRVKKTKRK